MVAEEGDGPEDGVDACAEGVLALHVHGRERGFEDSQVEIVEGPEGHVWDGGAVVEQLV